MTNYSKYFINVLSLLKDKKLRKRFNKEILEDGLFNDDKTLNGVLANVNLNGCKNSLSENDHLWDSEINIKKGKIIITGEEGPNSPGKIITLKFNNLGNLEKVKIKDGVNKNSRFSSNKGAKEFYSNFVLECVFVDIRNDFLDEILKVFGPVLINKN